MTGHEKHMLAHWEKVRFRIRMAATMAKLTHRFIWNYRLSNEETNRLNIFKF